MPTAKRISGATKKVNPAKTSSYIRSIMKPLGISIAALLVVAQIAFDVYVMRSAIPNADNNATIIQLLESAVEGSMHPVQVQADSGKQYISEVRLVFPATSEYGLTPLRYVYESAVDGMPAVLRVSSVSTVERAEAALLMANQPKSLLNYDTEALLKEVPSLQACSRGVYLFFGSGDARTYSQNLRYKSEAKLQDGRTLYMYVEQPNACKQSSFDSLVAYLKQVQSY